jgi:tRNA threonylcarbamoyladenosine biosynthesis protein TsaB
LAFILHIESSSTLCSVALSDGAKCIALRELNAGYTHAENLHLFIEDVLKEAGIRAAQLNAVAVSSGPGSYTGLRIGFSTAKGLAYALNIPLIVVDTLKVLTALASAQHHVDVLLYCPMLDARRMEVYTAVYTHNLEEKLAPQALLLSEESISVFAHLQKGICFFGDGMPKARHLLEALPGACFTEGIATGSEAMISLAYEKFKQNQFSDTAYAEPFYLKDFFFTTPKK